MRGTTSKQIRQVNPIQVNLIFTTVEICLPGQCLSCQVHTRAPASVHSSKRVHPTDTDPALWLQRSSENKTTSFPFPPAGRKPSKDLHWELKAVLVLWMGTGQQDSSCPHCVPVLSVSRTLGRGTRNKAEKHVVDQTERMPFALVMTHTENTAEGSAPFPSSSFFLSQGVSA